MSDRKLENFKEGEDDLVKKNWKPIATEYDPIKIASINGIATLPHDRGVIRAIESNYKPDLKVPNLSKLSKTLFVAKLGPLVSESDLENVFSQYGTVKSVKVIRDIVTKRTKGYGFVEFKKERHLERAYRNAGKITLAENVLTIDKALSRSMPGWKPRRLGGGFGGNKESGQLRFGCKSKPWLRPLFRSERRLRKM